MDWMGLRGRSAELARSCSVVCLGLAVWQSATEGVQRGPAGVGADNHDRSGAL